MPAAPDAPRTDAPPPLLVTCLCAGWCLTCGAYRAVFDTVAARHPDHRFVWVDIEDHGDALEEAPGGAPDIQDFPTLALQGGDDVPVFFGPVLPNAAVLERLVSEAGRGGLPATTAPAGQALAPILRRLAASLA